MEDERVAVRVREEGHVANPGVTLADELDALRLELGAADRDIGDPERDSVCCAGREVDPLVLRLPERQRDVAGLELGRLARFWGSSSTSR